MPVTPPLPAQRVPPVFWPDIDVYFKQDTARALALVDQLREAGCSVVKSAALHDIDLCLRGEYATSYFVPGRGTVSEPYREIMRRHVIPMEALDKICGYVRASGLQLVLSVYDEAGLQLARVHRASAVKIPSSNIVHAPLIRAAAASGLPLVLDTGRSRLEEIDRAVAWAREAGATDLLVQHSPPGPPAQATDFRLSMLPLMGRRYGTRYGLSDHDVGTGMFAPAIALGASVIEKGVCPDGAFADIDLAHALPVSQVPAALAEIQRVHDAIGPPDLEHRRALARPADRMGLVAARDLAPGEVLGMDNVRFAFPTVGIPVEDWDHVAGRRLQRAVHRWQPINETDLAPL
jgi:N,N'-diacetyllegionaminate synthase